MIEALAPIKDLQPDDLIEFSPEHVADFKKGAA
jgi:hypothetical protein